MPGKPQIYTVEEANALLPRLNPILARQAERMDAIESSVSALRARLGPAPPDLYPQPDDSPEVVTLKSTLAELIVGFREEWETVEEFGVIVKDVRLGLIDFHAERDGRPVFLCWRYGESRVSHWHPIDEGYDSRQPLESAEIPRTLH